MDKKFMHDINIVDAVPLEARALCIAGPSSGKTWLQKQTPTIMDTDDVWKDGNFFENWHELPNDREVPLAWIIRFLNRGRRIPWLTNIWGPRFLTPLLGGKKPPVLVYRDDPKVIRDIMHARPSMTPELKKTYDLKKISGWVSAWDKYADKAAEKVIILKEGQFLNDVVVWTPKGWRAK